SAGVSCMKRTSGSSDPKSRVSGASAAKAGARPSSPAMPQPTEAISIPRPTSAKNSRRVRGVFILSSRSSLLGPYVADSPLPQDCQGPAFLRPFTAASSYQFIQPNRPRSPSLSRLFEPFAAIMVLLTKQTFPSMHDDFSPNGMMWTRICSLCIVAISASTCLAEAPHLPPPDALPSGAAQTPFVPDPATVQHYGAGYRYSQKGWIVLHIEGTPYERGLQHGRLLAPEIAGYLRCYANMQSPEGASDGWKLVRTIANTTFLRGFDREYLEEMKGIADGATAAGARFDDRAIDLVDIAALNLWPE